MNERMHLCWKYFARGVGMSGLVKFPGVGQGWGEYLSQSTYSLHEFKYIEYVIYDIQNVQPTEKKMKQI